MKATETETLWAKVGVIQEICLIAKTVIMYGRDCFLQFHNLNTGEDLHLTLNNHKENGDGIKCFRGHPTLYVFAYAENCHKPNIYVKTYPDFQLINKLPSCLEGYQTLEFSDGSLLFSSSDLPTYKLTGWNWKIAEKITESPGKLVCTNQQLRCSFGKPMFLAQLGIGTNKLYIWDVFTVCKYTIFADHEVKLGALKPAPFQSVVWSAETVMLYIIDSVGCIYTVDKDFYLELVIDNTQTEIVSIVTPSICWYHHGLTVSGPSQEVKHYKKVGSTWICDSQFSIQEVVLGVMSTKTDKCIGYTLESEIVSFGVTQESLNYVKKGESNFSHVCLVNPLGTFIIVTREFRDIDVRRVETGEVVGSLTLEGKIASIVENPMYPFAAVGFEDGCVQLISFYNEVKPVSLTRFYLTENPLSTTRFFEQGYIFITGNRDIGEFFILKGLPGTQIEVVINIQIGRQVVDYMLVASQNIMRFFAIPVTQDEYYAGNQIWRWCIVDKSVVNLKVFTFEKPNVLYRRIYAKRGTERDRTFYLIPFLTRHFVVAETKRGDPLVYITDTRKTGHQIKMFLMNFTARHVISWGYEGFVFVRSLDFSQIEGLALCNHRYHQGVRKAVANSSSTIIVTLGFSGALAAVKINNKSPDEQIEAEIHRLYNTPKVALMFKRPTLGYVIEDRFIGKYWKEIERLKTIEEEEKQCAVERNGILEEFWDIQKSVQQLVDANFAAPDNKKLDLLEFYLDTQSYQKKQQQNKEDCKQLETYLKCLIAAQDKVSQYIIKNYYETMGVQWRIITGMFSVIKATSYCFLPEAEHQALLKCLEWINAHRRVERYLTSEDTFEPWNRLTPEELDELKNKRPLVPKDDYGALSNLVKAKEESDVVDPEKFIETKIALLGTATQLYVDVNPARYYQGQLNTFYQGSLQRQILQYEVIKLKQCYNKCFTNTRSLKEREMYSIKERNARLRHIISEFNFFSENKININIQDPEWQPVENVETDILRVSGNEVPVTPYVSPSEQAILDGKAAEEERIRLLLLADDFRERALMAMMNGVLEVRWEDELKKDVPKPKCMLEKDPSEFNEEDLRAIKDYEEKVAQLKTEREKYKSLLEAEFAKMSVSVRDAIRKFNWKLYECTRFKYHIDSTTNQETMIMNGQRVVHQARIDIDEKEKTILNSIKDYEVEMELNQKSIVQIQEALAECRSNMDSMQIKEKQLEKLYRKDFQDMSPVVQEQSFKFYKKRPKATLKNINTISGLNELAKGIVVNETNFSMPQECLDYIKALEVLDAFVGLPPTIDETVWHLICKHRRSRIEYEIRMRAVQLQVLEGEATGATFQKRVAMAKEKIVALAAQLEETRAERLHLLHNKQIQLVLRRGLVEVPINGDLVNDFTDAILVPRAEIEHVNSLIVEAGQLKIKTIQQNMKFRRTMMATEWEHMKLRMKINDFIEQKRDIEYVKFTKEMQSYLKNKSLGRKGAVDSYELEIELLSSAYENRIKGKEDKMKKIQAQLKNFKEGNKQLDKTIKEVNIDLCYYLIEKDSEVEEKEKEITQARMKGMLHRNQLVQKIQKNHNEILVLQAELELLRLRTFPTFKYTVYDNPE